MERPPPEGAQARRFLFLQGPHGPFYGSLADRLRQTGATVFRVGFNLGDQALWRGRAGFIPFKGSHGDWPAHVDDLIERHKITDLVCYGASRPIHRTGLEAAKRRGLRTHVFEEGYLRPYWITYERGGTNGTSALVTKTVEEMRADLTSRAQPLGEAPDHWGDTRAHVFWGATYHAFVLAGRRAYAGFRPHRSIPVHTEFLIYLRHLLTMPWRRLGRFLATRAIRRGGFPYHLVLLQLAHDANFTDHGLFSGQEQFLNTVFDGFAKGAPGHHHLVVKAHPLEDGRTPLRRLVRDLAREHGLTGRVHFLDGGKLAFLLRVARSAVTVNSTAAQQVLWRGIPLKAFGASVFAKPEFISDQPLHRFFANPRRPDHEAYLDYRRYLLATSQIAGGFYAHRSRRQLLRHLPDLMLDRLDPYERLADGDEARPQHIHLVR